MFMHLLLSYKLKQQTNFWLERDKDLSSSLEVQLSDLINMVSTGQEITMQLGNILEDQLLIISIIRCSDFKWLDLTFVDLEATQQNNCVQDGSRLVHSIHSPEVIMLLIQKIKNLTL